MKTYVGYSTSLLYWLKNGCDEADRANMAYVKSLSNANCVVRDLVESDLERHGLYASTDRGWPERRRRKKPVKGTTLSGPAIHVLVGEGADHNRADGFERHCWASHIPDDSFFALSKHVMVSTPEFTFLQLAGLLSETQTILVGYWLCAKYRVREDGLPVPVEPVTSVERLRKYLEKANGCYGARKARRALSWIVDNARSPAEVNVAMLSSLPTRLGGYGFGKPYINYVIKATDLDPLTLDRPDREYFEIDLYWPAKHVGLEYDGAVHLEPEQVKKDKRRLNCLTANGEKMLVVMYEQLADEDIRATLMKQLGKLLGVGCKPCDADARDSLLGLLYGNEFSI